MVLPRRTFLCFSLALLPGIAGVTRAQEALPPEAPPSARLGILLDTSAEMGFLVPQARKELRILNRQLQAAGLSPVPMREMEGASLDQEGSTSLGARKNLIYPLKDLFAEVDTVYWITSLFGEQSPNGMFAVEKLLEETVEGRPERKLLIRNLWQDQLQAGETWVRHPPGPESDPLDLQNRPEGWYRLLGEEHGLILRSWQVPPPDFRETFAFPERIRSAHYLKKLGYEGGEALFDRRRILELSARHGLEFSRAKEEWPPLLTGRRWLLDASLLPFPDEKALAERTNLVFNELTARESIEEDLARIEADKLGVVFGFGYVSQDLKRHFATRDQPPRNWREHYFADLTRVGAEASRQVAASPATSGRIQVIERIELASRSSGAEAPDAITRQIARMVREEKVDAIYLFTNGHIGGGDYGTVAMDTFFLALAIREAGVRLYVRVPFEFGPTPISLARLAMASGGGVFRGRADDTDWEMAVPEPAWPAPAVDNP